MALFQSQSLCGGTEHRDRKEPGVMNDLTPIHA